MDKQLEAITQMVKKREFDAAVAALKIYLRDNPDSAYGWYLLSFAISDPARKLQAIHRAARLAPDNEKIQERQRALQEGSPSPAPRRATPSAAKPSAKPKASQRGNRLAYIGLFAFLTLALVALYAVATGGDEEETGSTAAPQAQAFTPTLAAATPTETVATVEPTAAVTEIVTEAPTENITAAPTEAVTAETSPQSFPTDALQAAQENSPQPALTDAASTAQAISQANQTIVAQLTQTATSPATTTPPLPLTTPTTGLTQLNPPPTASATQAGAPLSPTPSSTQAPPAATFTPTPSPTPAPSNTPAPLPPEIATATLLGAEGRFWSGSLRVLQVDRPGESAIREGLGGTMPNAPAGSAWVLLELLIICDGGASCVPPQSGFQVVGTSGIRYTPDLRVQNILYMGPDALFGGQAFGYLTYTIPSGESALWLYLNNGAQGYAYALQ